MSARRDREPGDDVPGSGQLAILVLARARPGCAEDAVAVITRQLDGIRQSEPACVSIALHRDNGDPDLLMLYELWADRQSFEAFLAGTDMTEYLERLDDLLESREMSRWEVAG